MIESEVLRWALASAASRGRGKTPLAAQPHDRQVRELFERARSESRPRDLRRSDQETLIRYATLGLVISSAGAVLLRKVMEVLR